MDPPLLPSPHRVSPTVSQRPGLGTDAEVPQVDLDAELAASVWELGLGKKSSVKGL